VAAARQRAAALAAQRRAARIATARWRAAKLAANRRAAAEKPAPATGSGTNIVPAAASSESSRAAVPVVLGGLGSLAFVLLAMALIPAEVAPRYRLKSLLASRRQEFAISGVMSLIAAGVFFVFVVLGG
jgi:Trk-type K+ transport system membrane component